MPSYFARGAVAILHEHILRVYNFLVRERNNEGRNGDADEFGERFYLL